MLGLRGLASVLVLFALVFVPAYAMALDTNEPLSSDIYNIEAYLAFEDTGTDDLAVSTELDVVFGLTDSLNLGLALYQSTPASALERPNLSTSIAVLANVVDTEVFDMDLMLDFGVEDILNSPEYIVTPSFEFNFDADPDMLSWGIYARIGLPMYVAKADDDLREGHEKYCFKVDLSLTLGCYCWLGERHQFLLEQTVSVVNFSKAYRLEPLAVGYNFTITDGVELITEAAFTLPVNGDQFAAHLVFGFIWAL